MKTIPKQNPLNKPSPYGYIITRMRERGTRTPIGVIDENGDYKPAFADSETGIDMAVYPTREDAEDAIKRAAGDTDPLVYDGLKVSSLKHTRNDIANVCAVYGYVTYPGPYKPKRTDYNSPDFLD